MVPETLSAETAPPELTCSTTQRASQGAGAPGPLPNPLLRASTIDLGRARPARRPGRRTSRIHQPPPRVPGHRVLGPVGEGGMGALFLVEPEGLPGARRVCKVLKLSGEAPTASQIERQRREGLIMASVRHPSVLQVHSAGLLPDGRPYFVMDFAAGRTLKDVVRAEGRVAWPRACAWLEQIAAGLAAAHAAGVVHRDVKPSNLLLDGERAFLADFGLALSRDLAHMTRSGVILGTAHYFSPEQVTNPSGVGPAADVYSLGVCLFELLSGQLPLPGRTLAHQLLLLGEETPPPLRRLVPDLPAELDALVNSMLARDPAARPTAATVAAALAQLRQRSESLARPRAWPALAGLAAGLVALLLGGSSAATLAAHDAPLVPSLGPAAAAPLARPIGAPPTSRWWGLPPGTRLRSQLVSRYALSYPYRETELELEFGLRSLWTVASLEPERITFEVEVEGLAVRYRLDGPGPGLTRDYDSRRSPPEPYLAAVGRRFRLELERDTGRLLGAPGLSALQEAIDAQVELPQDRPRYRIQAFASSAGLARLLEPLLANLPDREPEPCPGSEERTWRRSLAPATTFQGRAPEPAAGRDRLRWPAVGGCLATFTLREGEGQSRELRWRGGGDQPQAAYPYLEGQQAWQVEPRVWRGLEGQARYHGGALRSASYEERWRCDYAFTRGTVERQPVAPTRAEWSAALTLEPLPDSERAGP